MRLLLVEDHPDLRSALAGGLRAAGYAVDESGDGEEGWWYAERNPYDLVILDRMLPKVPGIEILRRLRAAGRGDPVLLVTALDTVEHRVEGLAAGADDYLVKPFAAAEFLARVRSLVRRGKHCADPRLVVADLEVDTIARQARRSGRVLPLGPREFSLLEYLAMHAGALVTRQELAEHLYTFADEPESNAVDALVARVRRHLAAAGGPPLLHTRRGHGFVLAAEDAGG